MSKGIQSKAISRRLIMPAAIAAASLVAAPAQASPLAASLSIVTAQILRTNCMSSQTAIPDAGTISKPRAILGGAPSALELIQQRQAGLQVEEQAVIEQRITPDSMCEAYRLALPRIDRQIVFAPAITAPSEPVTVPGPVQVPVLSKAQDDAFLAAPRVRIGRTAFDRQWERVAHATLSEQKVVSLVGRGNAADADTLLSVNRWVNREIAFASDRDVWASSDYWASADQTLAAGRGDCEDVAILKYQMLLSLGVDAKDMYLTLARDLVRNADHAVLVVKQNDGYFLLDNATDAVLPAQQSYDYLPTLSFSDDKAWLHGSRTARPAAPVLVLGQGDVEAAGDRL